MPDHTDLTAEEIAELRRLHEAATESPWVHDQRIRCAGIYQGPDRINCFDAIERFIAYSEQEHDDKSKVDWDLVVAARNALPRLLATVERQARQIENLKETLDLNWEAIHNGAMGPIRAAIGNDDATVPEIVATVERRASEIERLRVLAERCYHSHLCSRHRESGHYECGVCYPDWEKLAIEHNRLKQEAWNENERLRAACDIFEKNIADATELWELLLEVHRGFGSTLPPSLSERIERAVFKPKETDHA